jgi:hypothetical protein
VTTAEFGPSLPGIVAQPPFSMGEHGDECCLRPLLRHPLGGAAEHPSEV